MKPLFVPFLMPIVGHQISHHHQMVCQNHAQPLFAISSLHQAIGWVLMTSMAGVTAIVMPTMAWAETSVAVPAQLQAQFSQVQPSQMQVSQAQVLASPVPTLPSQNEPSLAPSAPYQYRLDTNQTIQDKIGLQLDNQTLTDYDNFHQPIATLQQQNLITQNPDSKVNQDVNPDTKINQDTKVNQDAKISQEVKANQDIKVSDVINPDDYLPAYQQQDTDEIITKQNSTVTADKKNAVKQLYNKLMNRMDGADYIDVSFANADATQQPAKNIKSALEQVTVDSVSDFNASVNKLRQIALEASQAVGYYDAKMSFKHLGGDNIQVTLDAGQPVTVKNRIVDVRGEGGKGDKTLPIYPILENSLPPNLNDTFNHGTYKDAKATIEGVAQTNGFFDAKWLDSSVDIILPDKTAEVDLVYDTQQRYHFGDVKVYTIDKQGNLSDDPDKLPIKPELLQQLMPYQKGDPYYQPFVTEFANNLSTTRYFNGIDVDVILPSQGVSNPLQFANQNPTQIATADTNNTTNATASTATNKATTPSLLPTLTPQSLEENANVNNITSDVNSSTQLPTNQVQNPQDIAPLEFNVDDTTQERLVAIQRKAQNLLQAPEDIELAPNQKNNSKNPLVKVANAISDVAKKIDNHKDLPIQPRDGQAIDKLTPSEVYQQKTVPTYVVLNATKPREAQVGIGYETDVGVRVIGKVNNNLVNRNGYQAGISTAISKVDQSVEVTGSIPYKHPLNDKITGSLGYQHRNYADLANTFETQTLYANVARNIYRDSGWNRTYSLRYRNDELTFADGRYDVTTLPYPFNSYGTSFNQQALLMGYALNKTIADNRLTPSYGYSQRYSLELGADGLLSDANMAIMRAGFTGLYSFGDERKHQVLGRADLGYIYSDHFNDVPYRLRFFAGGDQSIRGYGNDTLSPTVGNGGFLVGGDTLAVGSLEYNYEFREGLRGAIFTDFGNAYDFANSDSENSTKFGVGAGVRWASPIGTVRLDVASGINEEGNPIRIHFFIGSPL
ncbi:MULTISPECIES: autotransporter assembly complex protein TamA [unclassified Moraxella]|uniref:autotransporter assembly complex protein TamA n=1 Tax=unclassified Moraxella TaxID=2685852 RepID=UPI003AF4B486